MNEQKKARTGVGKTANELLLKSFAIDESINGVAFADVDGTLFFVNKSFLRLWQITDPDKMLGKSVFSLFKSSAEAKEIVQQVVADGERHGEITAIRSDQQEIILKFSAKMVIDSNGPVAMMGSFVDITDLKKAEAVAKESEALLKLVLETLPVGVMLVDKEGKSFNSNRRFREIWGGTPDIKSQDDYARYHARDYSTGKLMPTHELGMHHALTKGSSTLNREIVLDIGEGARKILNCSSVPVINEQNDILGGVVVVEDITRSKSDIETIKRTNNELQEIIDALDQSSLVSITDVKGNIVKVNSRFCLVSRYEEHELLGKNHSIINSGHHDQEFWKDFWRTISRGQIWRGEIRNKAKDGTFYWVDTVINPIHNEQGAVTHFLSIRQDITDRKNNEAQLLQTNLRLAQVEQFVDLTTDAILVTDDQGVVVYLNKVASDRLGIPQEECINFNIVDFEVLFKDQTNWKGFIDGLKKNPSLNGERTYFNKKTGEIFPVDLMARHVLIQDKGYTIAVARDISELKRKELALRETRERLAEAQEIAKLGYWEHNLLTNIIWWSDIQLEIFGLSRSEVPKTTDEFIKFLHPDDHKKVVKVLQGCTTDSNEYYRIIRPDGEVRVIQTVAQITYNERGAPVKLSGVNQDITDRVAAEQNIRESEIMLRSAQRIARIGSWKLDVEKDILEWSDEVYKIFNVPTEKYPLKSDDFMAHVHPDDLEYVENAWAAALTGSAYDVLHRIVIDDKIKWVSQQSELTFNESSKLIKVFGTVQDITDQMILRNDNIVFNQSQLLAGIGSWRYTVKNKDLFWSDSVYHLFGIDKATTVATNELYVNAIYHEDRERAVNKQGQGSYEVEYRIEIAPDQFRWILEKGDVLKDIDGNILQMFGIVRDITAEKHNTEELMNARRQAEEAATIKDEFLSVMSHEIRTPLNSVIGLSNLLLKRTPREDQLEIMKTLKGSADNLMHLVSDILDYNKIRAGKLELESIPFSLNKFLQHLHASFGLAAQDRGLNFNIQVDPRIPDFLIGDLARLNQIFNNLLNNAIKFTHQGFVKMEVDLKSVSSNTCVILFKVEDTGVGIAADKLNSIFTPFQQSEKSVSRKYGGTGLGLSIVKTLVDIMEGEINLSSKVGAGSVFELKFQFPLSNTETDTTLLESLQIQPRNASTRTKKLEVLYVEDVESNRFLVTNLLSDYHIICHAVPSGQAALRVTKTKKFDVILMDIQMPKMDGYQATDRIRKQPDGRNCKTNIIAFTAEPYSEDLKRKIASHHIQDVITKPFDADSLIGKINALAKETKQEFFSFSFYERAFNNDAVKLKSIKKTVIKDLSRFESALLKYHKSGNLKGIRSEIHKMRPIIKQLECITLFEVLDHVTWPESEYTSEAASTVKEIVKLTARLLTKLEKLKY